MRNYITLLLLASAPLIAMSQDSTLITKPSKYSVAETTTRLEAAIEASGVYKIFYKLDHAANAEREAGAKLRPAQLILFGNPKGGAPLIAEAPTLAIDLPNRILVWEDQAGKVWATYNELNAMFARHGLKRSTEQVKPIEARQAAVIEKALQ
jgi:uncharacterized protein (DUF302 family)